MKRKIVILVITLFCIIITALLLIRRSTNKNQLMIQYNYGTVYTVNEEDIADLLTVLYSYQNNEVHYRDSLCECIDHAFLSIGNDKFATSHMPEIMLVSEGKFISFEITLEDQAVVEHYLDVYGEAPESTE